jgi:hypothetical protein
LVQTAETGSLILIRSFNSSRAKDSSVEETTLPTWSGGVGTFGHDMLVSNPPEDHLIFKARKPVFHVLYVIGTPENMAGIQRKPFRWKANTVFQITRYSKNLSVLSS